MSDLPQTVVTEPANEGTFQMRAGLAADLADAQRIIDRVNRNAPMALFRDPSDLNKFRARGAFISREACALACELQDLAYEPRGEE